jgi:hypothetical protein
MPLIDQFLGGLLRTVVDLEARKEIRVMDFARAETLHRAPMPPVLSVCRSVRIDSIGASVAFPARAVVNTHRDFFASAGKARAAGSSAEARPVSELRRMYAVIVLVFRSPPWYAVEIPDTD